MKAKCIQEKLIDSKWNPIAFKQSKDIQINLIESNESQVHLNKANWLK